LIDPTVALRHRAGDSALACLGRSHRYNGTMFMTPPSLEFYRVDDSRRHDFAAAVAEFDRLSAVYPALG
jgi:predicted ATPase